jgi:hypothetical protein
VLVNMKGKVVPVLNNSLCHGGGGGEDIFLPFLTSTIDGSELSVSRTDRFNPVERTIANHCIGGYVGHRTCLDAVEWEKSVASAGNQTPFAHVVACCYTY